MRTSHPRLLRLSDGRLLEYAVYGDPRGKPVLYCHGFLGSHHQGALVDACARRNGLRVIAPNRPGIGRSSPHKFPVMTAPAADMAELMDALGIGEFSVFGASGGGCFALSYAFALSHRVRFAGVAGCMAPLDATHNLRHMKMIRRMFLSGCHDHDRIAGWALRMLFVFCRRFPRSAYRLLTMTASTPPVTVEVRRRLDTMLYEDYGEVFMQRNGVRGLIDEVYLYFHWGFDLPEFPQHVPVLLFHGRGDAVIPWSVARGIARYIPRCRTFLMPGGHLTFLTDMNALLRTVRRAWDGDAAVLPAAAGERQPASDVFCGALMAPSSS
ncbi:MAG: alpha/beta hydrolase [Patescibacteria group bacterium]